jgi:hypothetical protein
MYGPDGRPNGRDGGERRPETPPYIELFEQRRYN